MINVPLDFLDNKELIKKGSEQDSDSEMSEGSDTNAKLFIKEMEIDKKNDAMHKENVNRLKEAYSKTKTMLFKDNGFKKFISWY